jgi:hypothetical protein
MEVRVQTCARNKATKQFIEERGRQSGPLLTHLGGSYLSRFQFNKVLESAVDIACPREKCIKSHSFRIGGATNAMYKCIPYESIKAMDRWQSDAAKSYIRIPPIEVKNLI